MSKNRIALVLLAGIAALLLGTVFYSSHEFPGTDEQIGAVAEKYAREVGVGERPPLINTDRGDLLLFLFALSGLTAGFYLGYQWRELFGREGADGGSCGGLSAPGRE